MPRPPLPRPGSVSRARQADAAPGHQLHGAARTVGDRGLRTQGPNLDQRTETYDDALFAIQNGGFSGAIMPANIVVGDEADEVARFVAKYAGDEAEESPRPGAQPAP